LMSNGKNFPNRVPERIKSKHLSDRVFEINHQEKNGDDNDAKAENPLHAADFLSLMVQGQGVFFLCRCRTENSTTMRNVKKFNPRQESF